MKNSNSLVGSEVLSVIKIWSYIMMYACSQLLLCKKTYWFINDIHHAFSLSVYNVEVSDVEFLECFNFFYYDNLSCILSNSCTVQSNNIIL